MPVGFSYKFFRLSSDALNAKYEAILSSKKSVYWEIYAFIDDAAGNRFIDILCEKASKGIEVKIIIDALGSFELSGSAVDRMISSGIDVVFYNKLFKGLNFLGMLRRFWRRNHRKVLIIDEEVVFIGGVNVWGESLNWNDLHVKLTGKMVVPLLRSFAQTYIKAGGAKHRVEHLKKRKFMKELEEFKQKCIFLMYSPALFGKSLSRKFFFEHLAQAKKKFSLMTPYFVPDKKFVGLIKEAVSRGVEVNLFLPIHPDWKFLYFVARFYYNLAKKAGANLFLSTKMNHGKAMLSDETVGFVGSVNFTRRSFYYNEESGLVIKDSDMLRDLNAIFDDIKSVSVDLNKNNYLGDGILNKIKSWLGKHLGKIV
jgi:cardiolipin synthase